MITEFGHGTGAIQDIPDKRDFNFHKLAGAITPFDWATGYDVEAVIGKTLPVKDQGKSYSCGGQAWSSYGNVLTTVYEGQLDDRSAKFIYAQTNQPGGGSAGRDNSGIVINKGWCHESILPSYENGLPPSEEFMTRRSDITDKDFLDAAGDKALSYATVNLDIESIAQAIETNHGVVIGIDGSNNGTWLSSTPTPPVKGDTIWSHWVYAGKCKTVGDRKFIGILNSWGLAAGNKGWQWISEDYFKTGSVWACWTLMYNLIIYRHTFNTNLFYNDTGDEVAQLQKALQTLGYFPKDVVVLFDGSMRYGDVTKQAVYAFQQKFVALDTWSSVAVWWNKGSSVQDLTRAALNKIFS